MFSCVWPNSTHLTYTLEQVAVVAPWAEGRPGVARRGLRAAGGKVSSSGLAWPLGALWSYGCACFSGVWPQCVACRVLAPWTTGNSQCSQTFPAKLRG